MSSSTDCFALKGLSHRYGEGENATTVLDNIDLRVAPREFVSLIGPSGCGKSTLLKAACGLLKPTKGELLLEGKPSEALGAVGYMPQNDLLMPWRTVLDNVLIGLEAAGTPVENAREEARKHFPAFGLEGFEEHYPAQISGGMRQRAALLRTFLVERSIYVLDEPFGKLDSLTRLSMHRWLTRIWKESQSAILFITHDLDEALFLSDRIYVMSSRPGRIIAEIDVSTERPRDHSAMARDPQIAEQKAALIELLDPSDKEATTR
jgi:ABC-type nitrate/sulfonate/bicarbonate transport system ATPase subunit